MPTTPTAPTLPASSFDAARLAALEKDRLEADKRSRARKNDPVTIICDSREINSGIPRGLAALPLVNVETVELGSGDYIVAAGAAVERKDGGDFVNSIMKETLWDQLARLKATFPDPYLLIEGNPFNRGKFQDRSVIGAMTSIVGIIGIKIIQTRDAKDTAETLRLLARHLQFGLSYGFPLVGPKPGDIDGLRMEKVLHGIFDIGPILSRRILRHFDTLENVFLATQAELMMVEGIGPVLAAGIYDTIRASHAGGSVVPPLGSPFDPDARD